MNWTWLNWSWLVVVLPAAGTGFFLGAFLRRFWEDDDQKMHIAGRTCIIVAILAWSAAFFHVVPLATNAIAFGALAVRQGLHRSRTRSLWRAMDT